MVNFMTSYSMITKKIQSDVFIDIRPDLLHPGLPNYSVVYVTKNIK